MPVSHQKRSKKRFSGICPCKLTGQILKPMPNKYGAKAQTKVKTVMHEFKLGTLTSGKSGRKVKSRRQAVAIGLSEARREGDKVPQASRFERHELFNFGLAFQRLFI